MSSQRIPQPLNRIKAIPHVMETIFEHLSKEKLLECRLVHKSWAWGAGRVIGKRIDKNVCALNELNALREIQNGREFGIQIKKVCHLVPAGYNINDPPSEVYDTVTSLDLSCLPFFVPNFVTHLFPNLQSLSLTEATRDNSSKLEPAGECSLELGTLPNLLSFELRLLTVPWQSSWKSLVEKMLEKAVNLECFVIKFVETPTAATLIDTVSSSNLKSIKINRVDITTTIFTALSAHPNYFRLETIDLQFIKAGTVNKDNIKSLLTRCSSSLRQLVLKFNGKFEMDFPLGAFMKKLHTLEISNFQGCMDWRKLPELKKLFLYDSYFEKIGTFISSAPQCCHLECLHVSGAKDKQDAFIQSFARFAEYLGPQLKSLELINFATSQPLLWIIFTMLTQLKRLTLAKVLPGSPLITDLGLCGAEFKMFHPYVETLSGHCLNKLYEHLIASAKASNCTRGPNITNLKELQFLTLEGSFSEVAVLHGIVHCEKLRELILFSQARGISRDSVVHLVVNADLKHLTRLEVNEERINHLRCAPGVPPAVGALIL